jgi:hypothetical protein
VRAAKCGAGSTACFETRDEGLKPLGTFGVPESGTVALRDGIEEYLKSQLWFSQAGGKQC